MQQDAEAKNASQQPGKMAWQKTTSLMGSDGNIDIKKFQPSAQELIAMTPSQKQEAIGRLKFVMKKAEEKEQQDPDLFKQRVLDGDMNPVDAYKKI